ncbi:MAG: AraC family transcriptional regulator [Prevotella sp.]|nr:AraC family transcriptional regulator [Prevotella sp.]
MLKLPLHLAFRLILLSAVVIASFTACGSYSNPSKQEEAEMKHYEQAFVQAQESADFQRFLNLSKQYYEISRKGHSDYFQVRAASIYGQLLTVMGKSNEARLILDQALSIAIQMNNDSLLAELYNGLAMYETLAHGNDFAAIEYYIKTIEKLPKDDKHARMGLLSNLTRSLTIIHDTTARYAIESYELSKEMGGSFEKTSGMLRMAEVLYNRKQFKQAKELLEKAYEVALPSMLPEIDILMVRVLMATRQFKEALRYADHAVAVSDTCKEMQPAVRRDAPISKAGLLSQIGKYEESNQWLDKITADTTELTSDQKWEICHLYTINHEHLGHYKEAMEYSKRLNELTLTQTNLDRVKILKAKEVALDVAQKDAEIEKQKDKADALQKMLIGTLVFTLLLIGLGISIFIMYRKKHQLMKIIVDRAETHEQKQKEKQQQAGERNAELFQRIQQLVEKQQLFKDPGLSRESLSALLSTSHTYISEAIRQVTGKSFPQYISDLRQQEAERMLHDPTSDTSSLKMLYVQVGFSSSSAFYKSFKKSTGMSPSSYLQIIQEERQEHH